MKNSFGTQAMTNEERFCKTYYFSNFLTGHIRDYLMLPNFSAKFEAGEKADENIHFPLIIKCAAGIISCLLKGNDLEVIEGIRALQNDFRQGDRYGVCPDPVLYYKKIKAAAVISRPFFYPTCDSDIERVISCIPPIHYRRYPGIPEYFECGYLPYWLVDALTMNDYAPAPCDDETIEGWVTKCFPSAAHQTFWEQVMRINFEAFGFNLPLTTGSYRFSFLFDNQNLSGPLSRRIFEMLEKESIHLAPFHDKADYYSLHHFKNRYI